MRIGIVGLGYWGKILLNNLESLGYNDFILCDNSQFEYAKYKKYQFVKDYNKIDCNCVFIAIPSSFHFKICKYFLEKKIKVFCEKPLTTSVAQAKMLYEIALKNDTILFTDWIYTFNEHVRIIKRDYEKSIFGEIKSITMNRLNLGPERFDVNARWDLASHDVSIIQYIFNRKPINIEWKDYKRGKDSIKEDSCLGFIQFQDFITTINVSWKYGKKVRECIFEFENYFVFWDDLNKNIHYEVIKDLKYPAYSEKIKYKQIEYHSPLINSINSFFSYSKEDMIRQKDLTIDILKILEK